MAADDKQQLIKPISQRQFEFHALSLERGPNFDPSHIFGAYQVGQGSACGCILLDPERGTFTTLTMRRRVDHLWIRGDKGGPFLTPEAALDQLSISMRGGEPPEPLPSGARRRPLLLKAGSRGPSPEFDLLTSTISHFPALMAVGECYLALPNPDANFVTDLQTNNFASRLFELYLLACFREQGLIVRQEHVSPDFWIEKDGAECWIEAVTANSEIPRSGGIGDWIHAPADRNERLTGAPAERFAKTLRGKLQRNYHELDYVKGRPFAIAIADFHESGSMVWSREALPTYLYGLRADVEGEGAHRRAVSTLIANLTGKHGIPAGLFRDPNFAHLSAVIFSNAGALAKFNRMGFLAGWRPAGLEMIRRGILFDRTPGALEPIDFELTVGSDEYQSLWPWGEVWCQELEVFHNPQAAHPIPFDLIPGATHWFERDGDVECSTIWANSVLSSISLDGNVRKGEHGTTVVYADRFTPEDERRRAERDGDEPGAIPFLKRFTVFNTDQCEGLPEDITTTVPPPPEGLILPQAEALIAATGVDFRIGGARAFYNSSHDFVQVPPPQAYFEPINWHRTAFHELGHASGHSSRLGRDLSGSFGSKNYAREELVAEMAGAFVCASLGIEPTVRHADYIGSWLEVLREDDRAIVRAASAASKAADYLLSFQIDPTQSIAIDLAASERHAA